MNIRPWSYFLIGLALLALLVSGLRFRAQLERWRLDTATLQPFSVLAQALPLASNHTTTGASPISQVVVGTPEYYPPPQHPLHLS